MIEAIACAKVNLSLRVGGRQPDGLHQLQGVFQSIDWTDRLVVDWREVHQDWLAPIAGGGPDDVIDGWRNLAWRGLTAARRAAGSSRPVELRLDKQIPVAAGLGGGSADAAAALAAGGRVFGVDDVAALAADLGSDVPFCFVGGTARVGGTGAELVPLDPIGGYALAVVVPPVELSTAAVFRRWDRLDNPRGPTLGGRELPPPLRHLDELANDLYPAAAAEAPTVEDWRAELAALWGRPVILTGSGPAMFAFFVDRAEAADALQALPPGARAARAAEPVPYGWRFDGGNDAATP